MGTGTTSIQLSVDRPAEGVCPVVDEDVVVEGWAWAPGDAPEVSVTVGGVVAEVRPGVWRPDVSQALGIGDHRGFVAVASVRGLPPGPAELVVSAAGRDGEALELRRTVEVAGPSGRPTRPRPYAGFPERLDPRIAPASMTHAEHVARYRWAAQTVRGRDVLDAACGLGFGARILQQAGGRVTGVDAFAAAIVEAREQAVDGLVFSLGDLRELPCDDDSFDIAVCFEAIEHVTEQERVIDELRRVLRPEGTLVMSTPIRGAIAVHNPHHVAELTPDELQRLLAGRFRNVELYWQHSALASVVDAAPPLGMPAAPSPSLRWTSGPLEPLYAIAVATDRDPPTFAAAGAMAAGYDIAGMISGYYAIKDELAAAEAALRAVESRAYRAEIAYESLCGTVPEAAPAAPPPPTPPPVTIADAVRGALPPRARRVLGGVRRAARGAWAAQRGRR